MVLGFGVLDSIILNYILCTKLQLCVNSREPLSTCVLYYTLTYRYSIVVVFRIVKTMHKVRLVESKAEMHSDKSKNVN